jgi:glucose-6-phosphate isomerase
MNKAQLWSALRAHPLSGWMTPADQDLPDLREHSRLLWAGIGGSVLPSQTIVRALGSTSARQAFVPLQSPEPMALHLESTDQVVLASKSGGTLELWTWIGRLRSLGGLDQLVHPPLVITQPDGNPLHRFAQAQGYPVIDFPNTVGGRFSAFTAIGTLPLDWLGGDYRAFLAGGREAVRQAEAGEGVWGARVWEAVEVLRQGYLQGVHAWAHLPYVQRLDRLGAWWVQLVAESLGKIAPDGTRRGLDPIRGQGPMDQHAQLQRWLGGPRKVGVFMLTLQSSKGPEHLDLPAECPYAGLDRWRGTEILQAQAEGTLEALQAAGVPTLHWHLERLDEATLGAYLMSWQLIVGLLGMALEIDPFDQPEVELGKKRTLGKLGL